MPLKLWECPLCGAQVKTKQTEPMHCDTLCKVVLTTPSVKMMETTDPERGKSELKDQQKILKARARQHARDVEMDDLIQTNESTIAHQNRWVMPSGQRRKKIDDR